MYRDNSLMPKETVRLAALGTLIDRGPTRYADLAAEIRHFTSRIVGPSLDLMGTSLEMLRYEGMIAAIDGEGMEDNALLAVTDDGRNTFGSLMAATVRTPSADPLNKLVITLKLRFLHLLPADQQIDQIESLVARHESELARLADLASHHDTDHGHISAWLHQDMAQMREAIRWFTSLRDGL